VWMSQHRVVVVVAAVAVAVAVAVAAVAVAVAAVVVTDASWEGSSFCKHCRGGTKVLSENTSEHRFRDIDPRRDLVCLFRIEIPGGRCRCRCRCR